ncbi:unnamed protein product, partial [Symbiodinium sp. CCMP2456]
ASRFGRVMHVHSLGARMESPAQTSSLPLSRRPRISSAASLSAQIMARVASRSCAGHLANAGSTVSAALRSSV